MEKRLWGRISFVTFFASVRDVVGGRSGAYESKLKEARDIAMEEMKTLARQKMRMPSLVSMWITK